MDLQSVVCELPRWEPFIRRFVAKDWLRHRLAVETDDVRSECRWRALQALAQLRAKRPALKGTIDETRIVNRAIARAFVDLIRKANRLSRCTDETTAYTIESGASWIPTASTPSLEDDYIEAEHMRAVLDACEQIRSIMGDDVYQDVLRAVDGEQVVGVPRADSLRAAGVRRTAIRSARRIIAPDHGIRIPTPPKRTTPMSDKTAASLNDDDLARVALTYKQIHGAKVVSLDRAHLLEKVDAVNLTADGIYPFPPCFTDATQYDPADQACAEDCDFRTECRATIPAYYEPAIEAQLVQLKGGATAPAAKVVKAPKAAKAPKPAVEPAAVAVEPSRPETKGEQLSRIVEKIQPAPAVTAAPLKEAEAMTTKTPKTKTAAKPKAAAKAAKPKAEKPAKAAAKPKAEKPVKAAKAAKAKKPREPGKTVLHAPVALSTRAGVLKGKTRKTRPDGRVWARLPQGSAAALAELPVGTKRERDLDGVRYFVKKIKDGETVTTAGGVERKRDGVWRLLGKAKIDKDGKAGDMTALDVEGSLGVITRFVTGTNVWSASRFWSIIPALLDPKSPSFAPAKWKAASIYAYGTAKAPKAKKAAKKAKAKAKAA
jgi:hypothetical protein